MPGIDQILSVVVKQGANELRLATNREPSVFAQGTRLRFTMAPTSNAVLRQLLGNILSPERDLELTQKRQLAFEYHLAKVGDFKVKASSRGSDELEVTFSLTSTLTAPTTAAPAPIRPAPDLPNSVAAPSSVDGARVAAEPTCTQLLVELVQLARQAHASDLHLADGEVPYLRVDGRLRPVSNFTAVQVADAFRLDKSAWDTISSGTAHEGAIELPTQDRLRTCIYRAETGFAAAVRILPKSAPHLDTLELAVPIQFLAEEPHGLVVLCGATGSGKSTTLAALCRYAIEHRSVLLVTLEDPIEFALRGSTQSIVRQRQIGRDVSTYEVGLRDVLRSDPDIIMVGELRDAETIRLALTAAETGHLVLASLHSASAASCIERIVDAYPSEQRPQIRVQLADALRAVVVQKLVPRAQAGGRVVAMELLRVTRGVANVIREGRTAQVGTMLQGGKRDGMISLERCLADYVHSGTISLETAKTAANDLESLATYLAK